MMGDTRFVNNPNGKAYLLHKRCIIANIFNDFGSIDWQQMSGLFVDRHPN